MPGFQTYTAAGILLFSALIVTGALLVYQKGFKCETLDDLRSSDGKISIAVMPFRNLTNNTIWKYWKDGIQISLIYSLSNSNETFFFKSVLKCEGIPIAIGFFTSHLIINARGEIVVERERGNYWEWICL